MSVNAQFANQVNAPQAVIAAANTARDGSGTLVTLLTAGATGAIVNWVKFTSAQAVAAAMSSNFVVRLFITDAADANPALVAEAIINAITPTTIVIGATTLMDLVNGLSVSATSSITLPIFGGLLVPAGFKVKVSQSIYAGVQDRISVTCSAGNF